MELVEIQKVVKNESMATGLLNTMKFNEKYRVSEARKTDLYIHELVIVAAFAETLWHHSEDRNDTPVDERVPHYLQGQIVSLVQRHIASLDEIQRKQLSTLLNPILEGLGTADVLGDRFDTEVEMIAMNSILAKVA